MPKNIAFSLVVLLSIYLTGCSKSSQQTADVPVGKPTDQRMAEIRAAFSPPAMIGNDPQEFQFASR